jgi:predicted ABC-type sugar transport system permease subunit
VVNFLTLEIGETMYDTTGGGRSKMQKVFTALSVVIPLACIPLMIIGGMVLFAGEQGTLKGYTVAALILGAFLLGLGLMILADYVQWKIWPSDK